MSYAEKHGERGARADQVQGLDEIILRALARLLVMPRGSTQGSTGKRLPAVSQRKRLESSEAIRPLENALSADRITH